jgi:hypothetical protein
MLNRRRLAARRNPRLSKINRGAAGLLAARSSASAQPWEDHPRAGVRAIKGRGGRQISSVHNCPNARPRGESLTKSAMETPLPDVAASRGFFFSEAPIAKSKSYNEPKGDNSADAIRPSGRSLGDGPRRLHFGAL